MCVLGGSCCGSQSVCLSVSLSASNSPAPTYHITRQINPPTNQPTQLPSYLRYSLGWETVARRRTLMVGAAAALIGPVAYLDIAYGLHGGDKPLTDYMFQVGGDCFDLGGWEGMRQPTIYFHFPQPNHHPT